MSRLDKENLWAGDFGNSPCLDPKYPKVIRYSTVIGTRSTRNPPGRGRGAIQMWQYY